MALPVLPRRLEPILRLARFAWRHARAPTQRFTHGALDLLQARWPLLADLVRGYVDPGAAVAATSGVQAAPATPTRTGDTRVLVEALRGASPYGERADAAQALAGDHSPAVTAALVDALQDHSVEVAVAAALALRGRAGAGAVRALRPVIADDGHYYHPLVRAAALGSLASYRLPQDDPMLHQALRDVDAEVSLAAIAALAERARTDDGQALLDLLRDDSGYFLPRTRLAAARALAGTPLSGESEVQRLLRSAGDIPASEGPGASAQR